MRVNHDHQKLVSEHGWYSWEGRVPMQAGGGTGGAYLYAKNRMPNISVAYYPSRPHPYEVRDHKSPKHRKVFDTPKDASEYAHKIWNPAIHNGPWVYSGI